jgi:hypothetical protein
MLFRSNRQKINTRNSTESELLQLMMHFLLFSGIRTSCKNKDWI